MNSIPKLNSEELLGEITRYSDQKNLERKKYLLPFTIEKKFSFSEAIN